MSHTMNHKPQSELELTVTVSPADYEKYLIPAAARISARGSIKGFRKGAVPYDIMRREVGEAAILEEALEPIIKATFFAAIQAEKIETIGMPKIDIKKFAPGNDLEYVATVALMPKVTLPDFKKIHIKKTAPVVSEDRVKETLEALRGMHAVEIPKEGSAEGTDKLVIDMNMSIDKVPVDGGQAKDYQVYLSEEHYIPGFNEAVKGLKKGDTKEFTLRFPETHYQKMLAGKEVQFSVTVKNVLERQLPELTDEMATRVGQKSVADLTALIRKNMLEEATKKNNDKAEIEMLDKIIEATTFTVIPEVIIDAERQKMFHELKRDLEKNNITIEQYLEDIKKNEAEVVEGFRTQAERRAKAALVSRQVAIERNITISNEEIDAEIEAIKEAHPGNEEAQKNVSRPEVRDTIASAMQNRKVIEALTKEIVTEV